MTKYGLPYKGSKSRIAPQIIEHLPPAGTLYDLFAGGCAITHAALVSGKWDRIVTNDITPYPDVFKRAVAGEYRGDTRWCSREEFFLTDDPLTKLVFSFGNDCRTYLYAAEIEPFKKACHDAVVSGEYGPLREFGYDVSQIGQYVDINTRRVALKRCLKDGALGCKGQLEHLERLGRVQHLERLGRVQHLERLGRVQHLESKQGDYRDVKIDPNSVIYCDIPYKDTNGYGEYGKKNDFDYDSFYAWAFSQKVPVFISEYQIPPEFECVWECVIQSQINADSPKKVVERLFAPKGQGVGYKQTLF